MSNKSKILHGFKVSFLLQSNSIKLIVTSELDDETSIVESKLPQSASNPDGDVLMKESSPSKLQVYQLAHTNEKKIAILDDSKDDELYSP